MNETLKYIAQRIYLRRKWIERAKYLGRRIDFHGEGHEMVRQTMSKGPCAIGKLGESELRGLKSYLKNRKEDGTCNHWDGKSERLYYNAGVFPNSPEAFTDFCQEMLENTLPEIDCLAVWFNFGECKIVKQYSPKASLVWLDALEPQLWDNPWLSLFEGKKVLVISPFTKTIQSQYEKRDLVWSKKPDMAISYELMTIKTPFCAALEPSPYESWRAGLEILKDQMAATDFDLAIIGAGAWSLPLAVHAKNLGKVGIHLGGPTQLLYGILGKRWQRENRFRRLFNEHWVHPDKSESPKTLNNIEGGCYW